MSLHFSFKPRPSTLATLFLTAGLAFGTAPGAYAQTPQSQQEKIIIIKESLSDEDSQEKVEIIIEDENVQISRHNPETGEMEKIDTDNLDFELTPSADKIIAKAMKMKHHMQHAKEGDHKVARHKKREYRHHKHSHKVKKYIQHELQSAEAMLEAATDLIVQAKEKGATARQIHKAQRELNKARKSLKKVKQSLRQKSQ